MEKKVLFTASTYSHLVNFHLGYLKRFREEGWTVHAACGGKRMAIPCAEEVTDLPFEKSMRSSSPHGGRGDFPGFGKLPQRDQNAAALSSSRPRGR